MISLTELFSDAVESAKDKPIQWLVAGALSALVLYYAAAGWFWLGDRAHEKAVKDSREHIAKVRKYMGDPQAKVGLPITLRNMLPFAGRFIVEGETHFTFPALDASGICILLEDGDGLILKTSNASGKPTQSFDEVVAAVEDKPVVAPEGVCPTISVTVLKGTKERVPDFSGNKPVVDELLKSSQEIVKRRRENGR